MHIVLGLIWLSECLYISPYSSHLEERKKQPKITTPEGHKDWKMKIEGVTLREIQPCKEKWEWLKIII